jgi:peptidoglycan hydrolase-like protein with peptidoglycan-binding domain
MEKINQVLKFNEFERLYESYDFNFINEAADVLFTPDDLTVDPAELEASLAPEGATGAKPVEEALDPKAFSPIKVGEKSDRVKQLQKDLKLSAKEQDGVFGKGTEDKVKKFQSDNKLTVDGKVGVQTLRKMLELNGDKNAEATITTKYKYTDVKTAAQATAVKIDPALLELFDVTLVSNGTEQFVIMVPKKNIAEKAKNLKAKFKGLEWLEAAVRAVSTSGMALIYTATGVTLLTLAAAKAMISSLASAAKFIVGGAAYVIGAVVQGLQTVANWAAKQGKAAYQTVSKAFDELFTRFCNGFAKIAKASTQAFTAFMTGLQTAGLVLTGMALKAFKAVSKQLSAGVKVIVDGAKDAAAFIKAGMDSIAKQGAEALASFKKEVQAGWATVTTTTQKAWNGAKTAVKASGEAVVKAAQQAYTDTASWLKSCYDDGKKFWESLSEITGDPIFESAFADLDFSIA